MSLQVGFSLFSNIFSQNTDKVIPEVVLKSWFWYFEMCSRVVVVILINR